MKRKFSAGLLALLLTLCATGSAWASVAEIFGVGGKAVAMGGAFTAVADDFSATWYNPAGLTQPSSIQVSGGLLFYNYDLKVNGKPSPIESRGGAYIGLVAPLFHGRGAAGVWGFIPTNKLLQNDFTNPGEPQFPTDTNRAQVLDLSPALAFDINPKFSIGIGFRLINTQESTINLFLPLTFNGGGVGGTGDIVPAGGGELIVKAKNYIAPNFGILWHPYENLKIGASYRYFIRQTVKINNNADFITSSSAASNFINTLLSQDVFVTGEFVGTQFYSPQAVTVGVAYEPSERLTLAANLDWEGWSQIHDDRLTGKNFSDIDFRLGGPEPLAVTFQQFINTKAHDIVIPRVGVEYRPKTKKGPLGPVDFQLRGGYAFRPSPFDNDQFGATQLLTIIDETKPEAVSRFLSNGTNLVDADRHIVSAGLGMTIDDPIGWAEKIQFDFWWQQQLLKSKHFNNQQFVNSPPNSGAFTEFGPNLKVNGTLTSFGVFATAKF